MNFSRLKKARDSEVNTWLIKEFDLTAYERECLIEHELVRFAPFHFYKKSDQKSSMLWRLTLPVWVVYWLIAFCTLPFNFLLTGKWGYSRDFIDKFHNPWLRKLGL